MLADREFEQLQMEVVQVLNQMQRVLQMSFFLLAFLAQQPRNVEVPHQECGLLFLGQFGPRGNQLRVNRFGAELQGPQQVFYLPQIEYVFGYVLPPSGLCDVHYLIHFFSVRCFRKYCCDLSRLRDWSTMFLVSVRIVR